MHAEFDERTYLVERLARAIARQLPASGDLPAPLGMSLHRRDGSAQDPSCVYGPQAIVVAQGVKSAVVAGQRLNCGPGQILLCGMDLPAERRCAEAEPGKPYLSLSAPLDKGIIDRLLPEADALQSRSADGALTGLAAGTAGTASADRRLLRVFRELAEFAEAPEDEPFMGPLLLQELHWRLLAGPLGGLVRRIYLPGGLPRQIACAVSWLRENYARPLRIKELAQRVNLSESMLFRQFKQATSLSPLQFQKRLRLEEARRLMVAELMDAGSAGFAVGYESPHQFSREYKRLFGQPPLRDASRQRTQ